MRLIFTCFFVSFMISLHAQIQDSFNLCDGYIFAEDYTYLIPNPDFEEFDCCPSNFSQMHCVKDWTQPSTPTSDFMHTCGFIFPATQAAGLVPFPSGEGIVGTVFAAGWQEYISVCLNEPIEANKRFFLIFKIAYTPITNTGGTCNAPPHAPIDIVVYGHNDCGSMLFAATGCPIYADPNWKVLGKTFYQPLSEWREMVIEINTVEDVNTIIIGSPCELPSGYTLTGCLAYFHYDDMTLVGDQIFNKKIIATEEGHPCSNDYWILAEIDTIGGEWQWFLDGEIIAGETDPNIDISGNNYASGVYSLRYTIGDFCTLYQREVNLDEMQLIHWEANIIHDDGTGNGSVEIIIEDERPPYQIAWEHGPDTFFLIDLEYGDYYATLTDASGCTGSIEVHLIDPKSFFVTIWNTELPGKSSNNQIEIPGIGANYSIFWQEIDQPDNRGSNIGNNNTIIALPNSGIYRVSITPGNGTFHQIKFDNVGDKNKLIDIEQWGDINWSSFAGAFKGCLNLNCDAQDMPLLHDISDMSEMFSDCNLLNGPNNIGFWDVSNVIKMDSLFAGASSFNQEIGNWNVANVKSMNFMFERDSAFNQNIGSWNVANVTSMRGMFSLANSFNQDIGSWNVANVTDMFRMFIAAKSFNQNIGNWDVGSVINMSLMFRSAETFNQYIGDWNVANVTDMYGMFLFAKEFNQDIGRWNVAKVQNMGVMFQGAYLFNQDIRNWDVSNVTNMNAMFNIQSTFNQDIGNWDVSKVTIMRDMFSRASFFNQDIGRWNVGNVNDMNGMFSSASSFNQDIGNWNVSNVNDMGYMFTSASSFNQDIKRWNVENVTNMELMFAGANLFNQDISTWNVSNVTNMRSLFASASSFNHDIGNWNVSNVTNMRSMFDRASAFNQDISSWNIKNITDLRNMLDESGMACDNYTATLIGWNENPLTPNGRILGSDELFYGFEAESSRNNLVNTKGWTISGDRHLGVNCLPTINTENTELNISIKLFPNPFDNQFIVEFSGDEQVTILLYDQLSRQVIQQSFYRSTEIDTEHLPKGLYMYELKKNNQIISSGKIVKQ